MLNLKVIDGYTFRMSPLLQVWDSQTLNLRVLDSFNLVLLVQDSCQG